MKRLIILAIVAAILTSCASAGIRAGDNHERAGMVACIGISCRIIPVPEGIENFLTWGLAGETPIYSSGLGVVLERLYQKRIVINGVPVGTETYCLVIAQNIFHGVPDKITPLVLAHNIKTAATGEMLNISTYYIYSDLNLAVVSEGHAMAHVDGYIEKIEGSAI